MAFWTPFDTSDNETTDVGTNLEPTNKELVNNNCHV